MDKTIDMAREANLAKYGDGLREGVAAFINALERFEALVRADEREACAKVCDELHPGLATKRAAELIRVRSKA
jgi:hypothetical protein